MPFSHLCSRIVHDFFRFPLCSLLLRKLCDTTVLEQSVPVLATLGRLPRHFSVVPGSQPRLCEGFWFFPCHEKQITPRWHPKYQQFSFSGEFAGVPEKVGVPCCFYWKASCICSSNFYPNSCVLWAWLYGPIRWLYTPYLIWIRVFIFIFSSMFEQMEGALGILCSFARTLVWQMMIHCRDVKAWKRMVFLDNLKNCPWLLIKTAKKWLASIAMQIKGLIDSTVLH